MINELIIEEKKFQPYLLGEDYTYIGPVSKELFISFFNIANEVAPVIAPIRSIHHVLTNKEAVHKALESLTSDIQLEVFIVSPVQDELALIQFTIPEYCKRNNIDYPTNKTKSKPKN